MPSFEGIIDYKYHLSGYTSWIADNTSWATFEALPLDGTIITIGKSNGGNFTEFCFSDVIHTMNDLGPALADIRTRQAAGFGDHDKNFAIINTEGRQMDWMNPSHYAGIVNNFSLMGRFAMECGLKGVAFDAEGYSHRQFKYDSMTQKATYTFSQYETQVYAAALQIGTNWMTYSRDFKFLPFRSYEAYYYGLLNFGESINEYGLYKAFLDGIYDAMGDAWDDYQTGSIAFSTRLSAGRGGVILRQQPGRAYQGPNKNLILTDETAFHSTTDSDIEDAWDSLRGITYYYAPATDPAPLRGGSDYFYDISNFGLGLWVDYNGVGVPTFDNNNPAGNHYTPAGFKTALASVLNRASWCWIFTNTVGFYSDTILNSQYAAKIAELRTERGI